MENSCRVNVRALAEFALEGGDLWLGGQAIDRMQEGMRGHRALQRAYPEGYRSEVSVSLTQEVDGMALTLQGRIDGLGSELGLPLVEEIKTTRSDPRAISEDDFPVHWAQAELYAYILSETLPAPRLSVRLTYYNLSGVRASFTRSFSSEQLKERFLECARPYVAWVRKVLAWQEISLPSLCALQFPYASYRAGQRKMAVNSYLALRDRKKLLCQAPTGTGKTAAALFPALKALGEGLVSQVFYLTARTTARQAAGQALSRMRESGLRLRSVTLTAKDKICAYPEAACRPDECPRALGYYDRRRQALCEGLTLEALDRPAIEALAAKYQLCPFELSLDLAENAQVIVCDYNYAFDPRVKLRRFFLDRGEYALLIDEAHNLCDRAREMLSAEVSQRAFLDLRRALGKLKGRTHPLYRALTQVNEGFKQAREALEEPPCASERAPEALAEALLAFSEAAKEALAEPWPLAAELTERFFEALNFARVAQGFDESYRALYQGGKTSLTVKLWCVDPAGYLAECMKKVRGAVLFSATLSPLSYYRDLLGLDEGAGDALLNLPSPFPPERLMVLKSPVPTRFRQREGSSALVARLLLSLCRAHPGNYLACFPSHAYLRQVQEAFEPIRGDVRVLAQASAMSEAEREQFLEAFEPHPSGSLLAFIALGGVFSEGVDLPGDRLSGAAIVGVGLPQLCLERNVLREVYEELYQAGYAYAYQYPGMGKVLQAAGRVIRSERDRGVVLLLDDRFFDPLYEELTPPHWQVRPARSLRAVEAKLAAFWAEDGAP